MNPEKVTYSIKARSSNNYLYSHVTLVDKLHVNYISSIIKSLFFRNKLIHENFKNFVFSR